MALRGIIFDIDGTLVDTNPSHVEAWRRAFKGFDFDMVGDTVYDGQACQTAGVVFLGVLSGCSTESELLQAGACGVWRDTGHLYADLDRALEIAALAATASEYHITPSSSSGAPPR